MRKGRITIHICTKDRFSELGLLLENLRHQTYQEFDIVIYDTSFPNPITSCHFLNCMFNRLKLEGHSIRVDIGMSQGVCQSRNRCIEIDDYDNEFVLRCDDDVLLEDKYIEKLLKGINQGYDMVTGVVPGMALPEWIREAKSIGKIMNEHKFDSEGNLVLNKDECGFCYDEEKIIPTHHIRTMALYRANKELMYPTNLSPVGFREEGFFTIKAILDFNYKIAVNTDAKAYHLQTPSGGCRYPNYPALVKQDDEEFRKWLKNKFKEKGDFFSRYNEVLNDKNY